MKLFEQLQILNQEEDVFISSKSAFFFIGTPIEFESMSPELDMQWYKTFYDRITNAENKCNNHFKNKPSENMKPVTKKVYEDGRQVERTLDYDYFIKLWESKYSEYEKQVEHAKELFYQFKSFRNREVLEVYRNIDNNATIIIVEGSESARFWFKSEWQRFKDTGKLSAFDDYADDDEEDENDDDIDISDIE